MRRLFFSVGLGETETCGSVALKAILLRVVQLRNADINSVHMVVNVVLA